MIKIKVKYYPMEIRRVRDIFSKHIFSILLGPFLKMLEAFFDLLIPLFMKAIIDLSFGTSRDIVTSSIGQFIQSFGTWVEDNPTLNYSLIGGVCILSMGLIGFLMTILAQYVAAKTSATIGMEVRNALYEKMLSLSKKERESLGNSKLLTILNSDTYQIQQAVLLFIRLIVRAPFIILGSLLISLILDWQIGLVFVCITPLILVIIFVVMRKASKQYLVIQGKLDQISKDTSDTLEGQKVIKAFNAQEQERIKFQEKSSNYQKESIKVSKLNALINPLTFAIVTIATILVVLLGARSLSLGELFHDAPLLPSTIITEVAYLDQILFAAVQVTNIVLVFTKAGASIKRSDSVLSYQPSIVQEENAVSKTIAKGNEIFNFDHVYLSFKDSGNDTLKDISFSLKKGSSIGFIGGTGSGKSTILSLMERFMDASKGTVYYKGLPIQDYSLEDLRNEISYVPQKSVLFKGTIASNLLLAKKDASKEEMIQALKDAQAYEFVSQYEDLLDHEVEEGGKNFSGGQRQRLCIARALLKRGEILILDDATSALDLLTDQRVRETIKTSYQDMTLVMVSQRVSTISSCEQIVVLEGGKIIAKGSHEELLSYCQVYQETYLSQIDTEGK